MDKMPLNNMDTTEITVQDCLRGAWQALLMGNTADRDKLCAMAERAFKGSNEPIPGDTPVPLGRDGCNG